MDVTIEVVMKDAGLTRGGFYRHFETKEELYAGAVRQFLCQDGPERWQSRHVDSRAQGKALARMIVDAYFSRDHFDDREGSCPVIGLPSDVARSGETVKAAYREVVEKMIGIFQANLEGPWPRERSLVLVALRVGGMVLARSIDNANLGDDFRNAAHKHVLMTAGWSEEQRAKTGQRRIIRNGRSSVAAP